MDPTNISQYWKIPSNPQLSFLKKPATRDVLALILTVALIPLGLASIYWGRNAIYQGLTGRGVMLPTFERCLTFTIITLETLVITVWLRATSKKAKAELQEHKDRIEILNEVQQDLENDPECKKGIIYVKDHYGEYIDNGIISADHLRGLIRRDLTAEISYTFTQLIEKHGSIAHLICRDEELIQNIRKLILGEIEKERSTIGRIEILNRYQEVMGKYTGNRNVILNEITEKDFEHIILDDLRGYMTYHGFCEKHGPYVDQSPKIKYQLVKKYPKSVLGIE